LGWGEFTTSSLECLIEGVNAYAGGGIDCADELFHHAAGGKFGAYAADWGAEESVWRVADCVEREDVTFGAVKL